MAWNRQETIGDKIRKLFTNETESLEKRAIMAQYRIKTALGRINNYVERLSERDKVLFESIVESLLKKDEMRAKMYAKEVAEIRKISKQLLTVQYALENALLKLETFLIYGGAVSEVKPVLGVLREAVGIVKNVAPDVWIELQVASRELEAVIGASTVDLSLDVGTGLDSEAKVILEEAKIIAEQKMREKFAELPKISVTEAEQAKT
ncbi:MAG: Snf7 family protein [Desulfurococcaceae archaeon]|jgi:division protein CdvB (Snf7/Vps24/ESCRT-III family)|nr:Snf7 family protein [Desulfurococcaceae archaeon]MCC6053562.1 Snf7 family protein [Desulfurococcaceae archaeon]